MLYFGAPMDILHQQVSYISIILIEQEEPMKQFYVQSYTQEQWQKLVQRVKGLN